MKSRWRLSIAAFVFGSAVSSIAAVFLLSSSIGCFRSDRLKNIYLDAYARTMREMPEPELALDLRTAFGVVRVYRFRGQDDTGFPVLLLPGRSSGAPVWADNMPHLLQNRSVYALDLLGEPGLSIQDCPITNDKEQAQWLHETIRQLPERKIHVAGLSIGGWTAANLAIHYPDKIASVALIDPVLVFGYLSAEAIVRSLPASVAWFPKSWRDGFNSWTANGASVEGVPVANMIEAGIQAYSISLPTPSLLSAQALSAVDLPVLAIVAGASRMHDPESIESEARRLLKDGTVLVYSGASHALSGEQPQRLGTDLEAFFAENDQ